MLIEFFSGYLGTGTLKCWVKFKYSPFHKTLSKSCLQMHWISVRFYEMVFFFFFLQLTSCLGDPTLDSGESHTLMIGELVSDLVSSSLIVGSSMDNMVALN